MSTITQIEQHLVTSLLSPTAIQQYSCGDIAKRELLPYIDSIRGISDAYVSHTAGTRLTSPIHSSVAAAAYALYYTPINAAKILHLLPLLTEPDGPVRILDLGCGPGTAGLALQAARWRGIDLTCVEHAAPMRSLATQLLTSFSSETRLTNLLMLAKLEDLPQGCGFDLVIAANVFAEMEESEAQRTLEVLVQVVDHAGYLILLEPGQLLHTRKLMALRDLTVSKYPHMTPRFPCLRADLCPMLSISQSDWCHGSLEWSQPPLHRKLDHLLGFNKHRIKFSCFIFQRDGQVQRGFRVLTEPSKSRSGVEALVCGDTLYGIARIPKRLRSEQTRAFEKAKVFNRLTFSVPFIGDAPPDVVIENELEVE